MMFKRFVKNWSLAALAVAGGLVLLFNWSGMSWKAFSVPTGSMRPAMPPGSLAIVHKVPARSLRVGDIITFVNPLDPRKTVSHRIVKTFMISGKIPGFVTKGDANKVADSPIASGQVIGKVVRHVSRVGGWLIWERQPIGLLLMIYIPALALMAEEVKRMSDYLKSRQPYRVPDFEPIEEPPAFSKKVTVASVAGITFVILGLFVWQPALALLRSNTVTLANNHITVAARPQIQCSSHNNISVSNSSTQTATSGSVSASGNTSTGSVTGGSASNSNSTSVNVTVTNC